MSSDSSESVSTMALGASATADSSIVAKPATSKSTRDKLAEAEKMLEAEKSKTSTRLLLDAKIKELEGLRAAKTEFGTASATRIRYKLNDS